MSEFTISYEGPRVTICFQICLKKIYMLDRVMKLCSSPDSVIKNL